MTRLLKFLRRVRYNIWICLVRPKLSSRYTRMKTTALLITLALAA